MDQKLIGKRALVTGSSAGIGEAIARLLAAEGAAIVVHGRSEERANAVAHAIRADGGIADVAIGDLTTDAGADAVAQASGDVDILVNNAGTYRHLTWLEATPRDWRDTYEANVVSGVRMIQRLVPRMRERRWGRTWDEIEHGAVRDMVPNDVGRLGRPEEIAAAVAYLASPFAAYVSGATLRVDGGTIRSV